MTILFPPELVPHVRASLAGHPALASVGDDDLAKLFTLVFFTSLEREEGTHQPIRVVFSGDSRALPQSGRSIVRWKHLAFSQPRPCTMALLRRLSRATIPDWTFIHVGVADGELVLRGLARQGLGPEDDRFLSILSPDPGRLEIWSRGRRELEYAHGRLMPAPENVILSAGPVQRALRSAAEHAGVSASAWPIYLDAVGGIVRAMSMHGHGGILVIASRMDESVLGQGGFVTEVNETLLAALHQLGELEAAPTADDAPSLAVLRATLSTEIERAIGEIGGLTALDGATILDPSLSGRAFGMILPAAEQIVVLEASGAEPDGLTPFRLDERGARHRAAAAFARDRPGSIVFVASSDGDLACMLREPDTEHVWVWRYRGTPRGMPWA